MSDLTNKRIDKTYKDLLKIKSSTDNAGVDSTLRKATDGGGTESALEISTSAVKVSDGSTFSSDTVDIDGGNIDDTTIGSSGQASGSFDNLGVKGLQSSDSAQTINPTSESMSSLNIEDVSITKAGFFGGVLKGSKSNFYDFLVIEPYSTTSGGSFVLDLELIATSGFDTSLPSGWFNVSIVVSGSGSVIEFYTGAGIDDNFRNITDHGSTGATGFKLKDVNNATLGANLNHNTNIIDIMHSFVDVNGDGTENGWKGSSSSSISAGVPDGTYTGKVRFLPAYHTEVSQSDFKADGITFSFSKSSMIGMARDLTLLGVDDTSTYDAHKVCYPDASASQAWVTNHSYGNFKAGTNGTLYPEAMQAGYAFDGGTDISAGSKVRNFGSVEDDGSWPYVAGYAGAANICALGSFGKRWPKMNDAYNWIITKAETTGNSADEAAIPEIRHQPVWGNITSEHNEDTGDGIDSSYDASTVEHTVELGAIMNWDHSIGAFRLRLFCTAGWSGAPNDNGTVFGINYNARVTSSLGDGNRYVKKIYKADWGHYTTP